MTGYIRVKNFDKFQHYKDRSPPWVKLHATVLEDYDFNRLQDASKAHLMLLWVLASRTDNKIPADSEWIKTRIGAISPVNIAELVDAGFIVLDQEVQQAEHVASNPLHKQSNCAMPEKEEETEVETEERQKDVGAIAPRPPKGTRLPSDWELPDDWYEWAAHKWASASIDEIWNQADVFRDYWTAQPGQKGVKTDWPATWRNWIRRAAKGSINDKLDRPRRDGGKDAALTAIFGMLDRPDGGPVGAGGEHPDAHRGDGQNGIAGLGRRGGAGDFD